MRLMTITWLALLISMVLGEKWSYLKENEKKRMEKKKEYRNVEEAKKEVYDKPLNKISYKKSQVKKSEKKTDETYLKDEKFQLCRSVEEDDVKNTLLKFGLVTHLYDEVTKFRKSMKSLQDSTPKSKKKKKSGLAKMSKADKEIIQQKGGPVVKLSQSNWVGRSMGMIPPSMSDNNYGYQYGTNHVEGNKKRRKRDSYLRKERGRKGTLKVPVGQVPLCYGWKYLKALDALIDDEKVDTEYLDQSVSDMLDMEFSKAVSTIIEDCGNALLSNNRNICPSVAEFESENTCEDQCQPVGESECQFREICCKSSCGGYRCLPIKTAKSNKCEEADQFMQCMHIKIDTQLCSDD